MQFQLYALMQHVCNIGQPDLVRQPHLVWQAHIVRQLCFGKSLALEDNHPYTHNEAAYIKTSPNFEAASTPEPTTLLRKRNNLMLPHLRRQYPLLSQPHSVTDY